MADVSAIRAGKAAVEISGDDKPLKAATDRAQKYLQDLGKTAGTVSSSASQQAAKAPAGWLEKMAQQAKANRKDKRASGESALQRSLSAGGLTDFAADSLGMGLQVMVVDAVGKGLKDASDKAMLLRQQLKDGSITGEEMVRNLAEGVPILGNFVGFFMNLRELITGEKEELQAIKEESQRTLTISNALASSARMYRDTLREIRTLTEKTAIATWAIGKGQYAAEAASLAQARLDVKAKQDEGGKAKAEALGKEYEPAMAALRKEVELARAKRDNGKQYGPELATNRANYGAAQQRLKAVADEMQQRKDALREATRQAVAADTAQLDARQADLAKRYREDWEKTSAARKRAEEKSHEEAYQNRLRLLDREAEAEIAAIRSALKDREREIDAAAEAEAQRLGAVNPQDPRRQEILNGAMHQRLAAREASQAKEALVEQQLYEKKRQQLLTLQELQIAGIANAHQRELAELDAKYRAELDMATRAGRDTADIQARWAQERANTEKRQQQEVAESQREMDLEIARTKIGLSKRGLAQTLATLQLERDEALRKERDPWTTTGVGEAKIQELYGLKAQMEAMKAGTAAGSFSARELSRMGATGNRLDEIAAATRETAKNTRRLKNPGNTFTAG